MSLHAANAFRAGESWIYRPPAEFDSSRLVVGAVLTFEDREPIVCCAVTGAPRRLADGSVDEVTIPFLPLTASALEASVIGRDGESEVPTEFAQAFRSWSEDPRGLSVFTVPFDGRLDRLIARQMAEIAGARLD
jgi:hypothetical protein